MENHEGRSLDTPRGGDTPLDVRETSSDPVLHRIGLCRLGDNPPETPPRPSGPVRVHSRPALMTNPSPTPITSSGPIRIHPSSSTRCRPGVPSGTLRRNIGDFATVTIGSISSTSGRLENTSSSPVLPGRTQSLSASRLPGSAESNSVSLATPRPETERIGNEYVEAPLACLKPKTEPLPNRTQRINSPPGAVVTPSGIIGGDVIHRDSNHSFLTLPVHNQQSVAKTSQRHKISDKVVTSQPSATFKKSNHSETECLRQKDSIICEECGRCKCTSCRTPRPLPSKWLCGDTCYCSAESIVDYATCLCCVKALFYHCANDESGGTACADEPCSCGPEKLYSRWGCLSLLAIPLPCLFCYWPCRGIVHICESCHQYFTSKGCRCHKLYQQPTPLTPEKRLLDSPE